MNNKLNSSNLLEGSGIANEGIKNAQVSPGVLGRWYTPSIIATEQSRENVAYGTLTTADEVKSVVVPTNGILVVGFIAKWKSSVGSAGSAAIFLGEQQIKSSTSASLQEAGTSGTELQTLSSTSFGLNQGAGSLALVTTGAVLSPGAANGGMTNIYVEAGTYNVSVRFKASSGNVTASTRKLWVGVIGA